MLTEFEALELDHQRNAQFTRIQQERMETILAYEASQPSFRSRVAKVFVNVGHRIDPSIAPRTTKVDRRMVTG